MYYRDCSDINGCFVWNSIPTCKLLAEQYPSDFIRWLLGVETQQIEILKTELTLEPIRADSITFLRADNRILHLEFQTLAKSKPSIPFRMLDYSVRLKRQYSYPVTQVVIFLQSTTSDVVFTSVSPRRYYGTSISSVAVVGVRFRIIFG